MKIFISSDHAGFQLKEDIKLFLNNKKYRFIDLGPKNNNRVDYPDYAHAVAKKVKNNKNFRGILVCGSGMGIMDPQRWQGCPPDCSSCLSSGAVC